MSELGDGSMTFRGVIETLTGHPMSGLWTMLVGGRWVHVESGRGVRALADCFGATEGTGDLLPKIVGKEIIWTEDAFGVMEAFTPAEDWTGPEIPEHGVNNEELRRLLEEEA